MQTSRMITVIPPTVSLYTTAPLSASGTRRVAGYARVSTDNDEQLTSYDAQVEYYTRYINEHEDWEFVGLYSDEGISGTNIKKRKGFQKMLADALDGKIDLIITKSISRFARNTVDSISTVRQLKEKGVEVFFEKDGLWTFDQSAELTITILSSIAQEESRNLSENVKWGHRSRYQDGKVTMPFKRFLGYERGEDGQPVINEEQAELVRRIYTMFVNGTTPSGIAKHLTAENIPTPGGSRLWQGSVVTSILSNEKYKGDALLQKTFCTNYLTKKMKVNEGEIPQYYVTGSHPPIVSGELFDHVQFELQRRKGTKCVASSGCFAGRIICGDCGSTYGSKVWHSTSKYRRTIWQCNGKFKNPRKCGTPHFTEEQLQSIFMGFINSLITDRDSIIGAYNDVISSLTDISALEAERETLHDECEVVLELMRKIVQENARTAIDQSDYQRRYNALVERYDKASGRFEEVNATIEARNSKRQEIGKFIKVLNKRDTLLMEFDDELWLATVHQLKVKSGTEFTFVLKDGAELPWK